MTEDPATAPGFLCPTPSATSRQLQCSVTGLNAAGHWLPEPPPHLVSQHRHEDAEMVYRVYSSWINEFDGEQVDMLNDRLGFAPNMPPEGRIIKLNK